MPSGDQRSFDLGGDVRVLAFEKLRSLLNDRHSAAESGVGLREFQAHITSADHNEVLGQAVEFKRLNVRERFGLSQARDRRNRGMRAEIQEYPFCNERPRAAAVESHLNRFTVSKLCFAHDKFSAGRFVAVQVHRDQTVHHLALAFPDCRHVGRNRTRGASESVGVMDELGDLGAPDFVLARKTIDVRAGTANPAPFDDHGPLPGLREMPGEVFPTFAASYDHVPVTFRSHLGKPPRDPRS